jgi:flagellar protein FliT
MYPMPSQLELYEEMSQLSSRMVEAARANEWEQLVDLERNVAALRGNLASSVNDATEDNLSPVISSRKRILIQRILEDDAEVRRHTEPWMEHVRQFLGDTVRRRDVHNAYAAGAGGASSGIYGS